MSILKMAATTSMERYKEPEMVDKAISGALMGVPGSVAYGSAKNYTSKVLNPKNFTPKKALKSFGKTMAVGTGLTVATTPLRNMLDNVNQGVGEIALDADYSNLNNQKEHDRLRENTTTTGAALTAGTLGTLVGGPVLGLASAYGAGQQTYLNEKLESRVRQNREKLLEKLQK